MSIHKYKTKKGILYYVSFYIGLDAYGKKKRHLKRGFKTKKEAKLYEARLEAGVVAPTVSTDKPNPKVTYKELYQEWFNAYVGTVEETTSSQTKNIYRIHILPIFGDKFIDQISPLDCQNFITQKSQTFKNIKQIKSYTSKIFDFAINMNYIDRNPMKNVIMPKIKKTRSDNFWSLEELHHFLDIVKETEPFKHFALFRLLAFSGLRKGELYALKWADINFDSNLLNIDKSLGRIDGKAIEKSTKNESSVRTIYLDDETIDIIKQWRNFYLKEQSHLPLTKLNISDEYMFSYISSNDKIEPLHADYINNVLNRIIKKHKLKPISPHGFRHTHATLMSEIGIDPSNTSKRLGHASSQVTLDVYTHTTKTGEKNSIDKFADYLNKAK